MALPVLNFATPTFAQANPVLTGIQADQNLENQFVTNHYRHQLLAQALQNQVMHNQYQKAIQQNLINAQNARNQMIAQMAPSATEAGIAKNLAIQKYAVPQMEAALQATRLKNQYMPLTNLIQTQNTLTKMTQLQNQRSRFGKAYQLQRMVTAMPSARRALWFSDPKNSQAWDEATAIIGNQLEKISSSTPSLQPAIQQALQKLNIPTDMLNKTQLSPLNSSKPSFQLPSPHQEQAEENIAKSEALRKSQTTAQLNQRLYSVTARNLYNTGTKFLPSVEKFAGLKGKAKEIENQLGSSLLGHANPDYNRYLQFKYQIVPTFANELKRALGGQATDQESQIFKQLTMPGLSKLTPKQVQDLWQNLGNILAKQEKTLRQSPALLNRSQQKRIYISPQGTQITEAQVEEYAKATGLTIPQVIARKGLR